AGGKSTGLQSAQAARSCRLPTERRRSTPEALSELFRDWQRTQTQSSVTALWSPRPRMDVRFCARQEPLPRGIECALRVLQSLFWALSRAPPGRPLLALDKDWVENRVPHAGFARGSTR